MSKALLDLLNKLPIGRKTPGIVLVVIGLLAFLWQIAEAIDDFDVLTSDLATNGHFVADLVRALFAALVAWLGAWMIRAQQMLDTGMYRRDPKTGALKPTPKKREK